MGEVHKARDTRLDRTVAIKVFPSHIADKPQLRERFEREAWTIASLNHSHICTFHDIGQQGGIYFLVMEYLEGETLAERLTKGPLPLDQVLRYAIEIADALDKAHRQDATHQGLKPGNIMLTEAGVKLLDFGLAKLTQESAPAVPFSQLPNATDSLSVEEAVLGTLQYMAPEQVEGKIEEADARTDIFAFGAVIYEMVTGKKAFEGNSAASVIGAVMRGDPPPISTLRPMTPPALDRVVKRCLAKDKEERWQTAYDLWHDLKWIAEGVSEPGRPLEAATVVAHAGRRRSLPLTLALVVGAVISGIAVWNLKPLPQLPPITRFALTMSATERLTNPSLPDVALSPDGTRLVYAANQRLYLRSMDRREAVPIPGTGGGFNPFFSPDGQWVGFFAGGKLKKVSITSGAPLILCDATNPRGATWAPDDTIIFAPQVTGGLSQISAAGGTPQPLTGLEGGESSHRWPELLPGGKALLFAASGSIVVQQLETGERQLLVEGGTYPRYVPTGHVVYAQVGTPGTLMAVPFDLERLEVTGDPVPLFGDVRQLSASGFPQFSFSRNGSLVRGINNRKTLSPHLDRPLQHW